jgi:TonB-dependent SusC/RagA subfamily outer membrane receptor
MMMKKKSSPWMRTKALYVIPVAGIALSAFATSEFTNSVELISESKVNELPEMVQTAEQKTIVEPVQDEPKKEPLIVVDGKVVEVDEPFSADNADDNALYKVIGLKPEDISHITVLKGVSGTAIYGDKGANGVIEIATKKVADKSAADTVKVAEEPGESGIFIDCEQMPEFPGGHGELMKFIASNIRYPKLAVEYGVKGRVLVQFVVNKDGSVGEHSILSSKITRPINRTDSLRIAAEQGTMLDEVMVTALQMTDSGDPNILSVAELKALVQKLPGAEMDEVGNVTINGKAVKTLKVEGKEYKIDQNMVAYQNARIALEEEAVRVLKLMPKWTPGMQRGKAVRVRYTMPVIYRLQ